MKKKFRYVLLLTIISLLFITALRQIGVLGRMELSMLSWTSVHTAQPSPATKQVKLVYVDQFSLDWASKEMGIAWPWPREIYAFVQDFLTRQNAKAVAWDVLFTEPSFYGPDDDQAFADAIARAGNVAIPVFLSDQTDQQSTWPSDLAHKEIPEYFWTTSPGQNAKESWFPQLTSTGAAFPIAELADASRILANVKEETDVDNVFRRVSLIRYFDGHPFPSLGLACWFMGEQNKSTRQSSTPFPGLRVLDRSIPLDPTGRLLLRFRGPTGTYEAWSAAALLQSEQRILEGGEGTVPDGTFQNAYVICGFSAPGLKDLRPTPMGGDYPGSEIYATLLDNLLQGDFLREINLTGSWIFIFLCTGLTALFTLLARTSWQHIGVLFLNLVVSLSFYFGAYTWGVVFPVASAITGVLIAFMGGALLNFIFEGRQKMFIKGAFKHYLSRDVIEQILKDPSQLKLGGERRELTIFFSDLQGFSSFSERLNPEELTTLLNDYLSDMTDIIMEEGGTLDKYEGDAIIAFWNAPLPQSDHAIRAVRAAVRCQQKLSARREEFEKRAGSSMRMRIGLHSGPVVVGNMGSRERFDYTILGDAATLASRLEGANKALGTYLMISEATWMQTQHRFPGRELGQLRVVGRQTPVRVFEATGLEGEINPAENTMFESALQEVGHQNWTKAIELWTPLAHEPAAAHYLNRCRDLLEKNQPWDGIWNLTEK